MKTVLAFLLMAACLSLVTFPLSALAQDAGPVVAAAADIASQAPPGNELDVTKELIGSVKGGQWRLAMASLLSLAMMIAYRFKIRSLPMFKTKRGGVILLMVLGFMGAFATALGSHQPINFDLIVGTITVALTAAGGWHSLRALVTAPPETEK